MKSYTKESKPFVPDCKDYFSRYCVEDCNWFGVCWDFQKEVMDDNRIQGRDEGDPLHGGVPDMVDELRKMDGRTFVIEKYVTGRYYYLKGCVSKAGVPFAILPHWFRVVRDV